MITIRSGYLWKTFLFTAPVIGVGWIFFMSVFLLVFFGYFSTDQWVWFLGLGGCVGVGSGANFAWIMRDAQVEVLFAGNISRLKQVIENTSRKAGYQFEDEEKSLIIYKKGAEKALIRIDSEIRFEPNQIVIEGPMLFVKDLKPIVATACEAERVFAKLTE